MLELERQGLNNVRVIQEDAAQVLEWKLPPRCLSGVYLFFPDPWHKTRHHKRRLVTPAFAASLSRVMEDGGTLWLATDWQDYAQQMQGVFSSASGFNLAGAGSDGFVARCPDRPLTRFEQRGQRLGHGVWDLAYCFRASSEF
ncbi:tRNA (guanine-N7-)-methyltransferase [Gammaproteobacteria bacterium]